MKLNERLYIGSQQGAVISAHCYLTYKSPGTAQIVTDIEPKVGQIIAYECGYNNALQRWFTGYIESYKEVNNNEFTLFARELTGLLRHPLPLYYQHITLTGLLEQITDRTGIEFVVPDKDYATAVAPYIINCQQGYALMDNLGSIFGINKYIWQQQGNGKVFVGSWSDSIWANANIPIPANMLTNIGIEGATIAMIPALRPGVIINGQRIRNIELQKDKMTITWITK
ncbi:hypothetical protein CTM97_00600 [Photobacterium phosphoreum]|uniref:Uncharacterized protein n=1 Tax=Photobacterium phosphoreum TaxID=659 RepID=A0A2T3JL53_PHOPO|nr:hypothetical protein [Photobacterium phosphoreum]PSU24478.1 hypothetical protein CTM96_12600 [Photobacterium phosphoreum]PSU44398.1 hypothetical protein CTM97_00600 [Photobacterium phosphoreum]PSU49650.1 hypothetical protein C9J18_15650 [Photobacterium phosphoreum]